jgi:hypothetical protein
MTFLDKYELLRKSIPVPAVYVGPETENCKLVDYTYQSKNCYYCFDSFNLEDSMYCFACWGKNLIDCRLAVECELCYECIDTNKCYNSSYLSECNGCRDCHFSSLCISCSDCFGCVGLTHKQYCIFNKQYTKEEYFKKVKTLKKENTSAELLGRMLEFKKTIPHPASWQFNNENCPYGDNIFDSKNSYWCFNGYWVEDSGFVYESGILKNCWDIDTSGSDRSKSELCYELSECSFNYQCAYLFNSAECTNTYYSSDLSNCTDCFGCIGLSNKKYCILNNQLTKEEYEKTIKIIKTELGWKSE